MVEHHPEVALLNPSAEARTLHKVIGLALGASNRPAAPISPRRIGGSPFIAVFFERSFIGHSNGAAPTPFPLPVTEFGPSGERRIGLKTKTMSPTMAAPLRFCLRRRLAVGLLVACTQRRSTHLRRYPKEGG